MNKPNSLVELFSDGRHWTTKHYARSKSGEVAGYHETDAVCWCLTGGCYLVYCNNVDKCESAMKRLAATIQGVPGDLVDSSWSAHDIVVRWNDHPGRTVQEVQELCEKAKV